MAATKKSPKISKAKAIKLPTYDKPGDSVAKEVNERKRGIKT